MLSQYASITPEFPQHLWITQKNIVPIIAQPVTQRCIVTDLGYRRKIVKMYFVDRRLKCTDMSGQTNMGYFV